MYMSDLACWDEACAHLTVRRHFPCQSEARASCCSGFREMLLLYKALPDIDKVY